MRNKKQSGFGIQSRGVFVLLVAFGLQESCSTVGPLSAQGPPCSSTYVNDKFGVGWNPPLTYVGPTFPENENSDTNLEAEWRLESGLPGSFYLNSFPVTESSVEQAGRKQAEAFAEKYTVVTSEATQTISGRDAWLVVAKEQYQPGIDSVIFVAVLAFSNGRVHRVYAEGFNSGGTNHVDILVGQAKTLCWR